MELCYRYTNIPHSYADGEIVRVGTPGDHGDGAYSSGRGGQGNIGAPGRPHSAHRNDADSIPPAAVREGAESDHHVGRGGQGNVVKNGVEKKHPTSLADKLKNKIFGGKKTKKAEPTTTTPVAAAKEQPKA